MGYLGLSADGRQKMKPYAFLLIIVVFSMVLFAAAGVFKEEFSSVTSVAGYLTWHNVFEFCGILISFAIFLVVYNTYDQTGRLRALILGNTFLIVGLLDSFHTFSFEGMPDFFVPNNEANRATTYWIIARAITAIGLIAAAITPVEHKIIRKKKRIFAAAAAFCLLCFAIVTYFPGVLPSMYMEGKGLTDIKIALEYMVIVLFLFAAALFILEYFKTGENLALLMAGALILSIFSEYAFVSYIRVYDVYNYLGHIYKFLAYFIFFRVIFLRNIRLPYEKLKTAQEELKNYADNLDRLVEQRTRQLKEMNQRLLNDLEYARDIQKALLPEKFFQNPYCSLYARYFPAERVSGDFYNYFKIDDSHIGMYIGDVSGHGVPAAMLTVFVNQSIKARWETGEGRMDVLKPSSVLQYLYESYNRTNFKEDVYVVLLYAVYSIPDSTLTYASAGFNMFPLLARRNGEISELEVKGFPLCKFKEFYSAEYEDYTLDLAEGDKILFYTDGLVDAEDSEGREFSTDRLTGLLKEAVQSGSHQLIRNIEKNFFDYIDISRLKDDVTFFVMEVK